MHPAALLEECAITRLAALLLLLLLLFLLTFDLLKCLLCLLLLKAIVLSLPGRIAVLDSVTCLDVLCVGQNGRVVIQFSDFGRLLRSGRWCWLGLGGDLLRFRDLGRERQDLVVRHLAQVIAELEKVQILQLSKVDIRKLFSDLALYVLGVMSTILHHLLHDVVLELRKCA